MQQTILYEEQSSGLGFVIGIILAAIIAILLLTYAIPALKSNRQSPNALSAPDQMQVQTDSNQPASFLQ